MPTTRARDAWRRHHPSRYRQGGPIMKKFGMLGIIGGAALLNVAPFFLQWAQDEGSLSRAHAASGAGVHRRVYPKTNRPAASSSTAAGVTGYGHGRCFRHHL